MTEHSCEKCEQLSIQMEANRLFYQLTLKQRDYAWLQIKQLREVLQRVLRWMGHTTNSECIKDENDAYKILAATE